MDIDRLKKDWKYDEHTGIFNRVIEWKIKKYGYSISSSHKSGYVYIQIDGKKYGAHRLAWLYTNGYFPDCQIDHINGIRDDNRICNLREVTNKENQQNSSIRVDNKSGQVGVSWFKTRNTWRAVINVDGKQISLGYFKDIDDAISARKNGEKLYGFHENHGKLDI